MNVVTYAKHVNSNQITVLYAQLTELTHQNVNVHLEPSMMVKMKNAQNVHMNA